MSLLLIVGLSYYTIVWLETDRLQSASNWEVCLASHEPVM